jgi:hypothetical protein
MTLQTPLQTPFAKRQTPLQTHMQTPLQTHTDALRTPPSYSPRRLRGLARALHHAHRHGCAGAPLASVCSAVAIVDRPKGIYAPDLPHTKSSEGREAPHHAKPLARWKTCFSGKCGAERLRHRPPYFPCAAGDSAEPLDSLEASTRCLMALPRSDESTASLRPVAYIHLPMAFPCWPWSPCQSE